MYFNSNSFTVSESSYIFHKSINLFIKYLLKKVHSMVNCSCKYTHTYTHTLFILRDLFDLVTFMMCLSHSDILTKLLNSPLGWRNSALRPTLQSVTNIKHFSLNNKYVLLGIKASKHRTRSEKVSFSKLNP